MKTNKLSNIFLAENVIESKSGKLTAIDIFNAVYLNPDDQPAELTFHIFGRYEFNDPPKTDGKIKTTIRIFEPNSAQEIGNHSFEVAYSAGRKNLGSNFVIKVPNFQFTKPGDYKIIVENDQEKEIGSLLLPILPRV